MHPLVKYIVRSFYFFFLILLFFSHLTPFRYPSVGIDASWNASLALAIDKGLIFGKDFIFNYGPLGIFNTGVLPAKYPAYIFTIYYLFIILNVTFIINCFFDKYPKAWLTVAFICFWLIFPQPLFADATFTLFWIFLFWLFYYLETQKIFPSLMIAVLAAFIIPIKLNISLFVLSFAFFVYVLTAIKGQKWRHSITGITLFIVLMLLENYLLHFNFWASFLASIKIIDAYQDAMAVVWIDGFELTLYLILTLASLVAFVRLFFSELNVWYTNILLFVVVGIAWFLQYKQAVTALALNNVFGFIAFLIPLGILILLFHQGYTRSHLWNFMGLLFAVQILGLGYVRLKDNNYNLERSIKSYFPEYARSRQKFVDHLKYSPLRLNPRPYLNTLLSYDHQAYFKQTNENYHLPERIKRRIGFSTVDILPWEISYLYFNKLNYHPRPVIQSYQANSDWLVERNRDFFWGRNKPKFVLVSLEGFREQNPFWSDVYVQASLKENYTLTDTLNLAQDTLFLFENTKFLSAILTHFRGKKDAYLNQEIPVPYGLAPLYFKASVRYDFWGSLARFFFQPPYLRCEITDEKNKKYTFRLPPSILRGGIQIKDLVLNNSDFVQYHTLNGRVNSKIKSVKLFGNHSLGFKDLFEYEFFEIR